MTTLMIIDLPRVDTLHRDATSAMRGGILQVTKPGSENTIPGMPPSMPMSWPGAALLKDLHIPVPLPTSPERPAQDPRLL
ncbi:hypothetical protein [Caballeronia ptereochthonis]|uniref:Uncharacterized protein n=1 Tax=Caballeronia ptereochthonis TaxID=1777144 RepID=A0A158CFL6_9BURK|nr:hypothetical protein [Caballeronia ptereochthonis]SAK80696.1 hypothetical protein AWB83_04269 [Caballeronia ptereochthonis]